MTQKQNGDLDGGKTFLSTSKDSEASQVRHLHVSVVFLLLRHCSSGICSWSPNGEPALQPVGLTTFEGASQPKAYRIMGEPGQYVGARCFVIAAVFDHQNMAVTLAPSLPYLLDLVPFECSLFSKTKLQI
jgi:hypothetical protein